MAEKMPGVTGENLFQILELRLDNAVARLGFAMSRPESRQLVTHRHFTVNGKLVNIPSYLLKVGDVISVREKSRQSEKIKAVIEANASKPITKWLELDRDKLEAKVVALPTKEDIELPIEEHLIVELYSK